MNRQQRRTSNKFKNSAEISGFVDKFSMDLSKLLMDRFEENKNKPNEEIVGELESIMQQRGMELGEIVKNKILKKQGSPVPVKINIKG